MEITQTFKVRFRWLFVGVSLWAVMIAVKLVQFQVIRHDELKGSVENQLLTSEEIPAVRGEIMDRFGRTLAIAKVEFKIFADPTQIDDPNRTVQVLGDLLKWSAEKRTDVYRRVTTSNSQYQVLERKLSETLRRIIEAENLKGIGFDKDFRRQYPNGWIASQVLGFVSPDGSVTSGIEHQYNEEIKGKPGKREVMRDGRRRRLDLNPKVLEESQPGSNLQLTLDTPIQFFLENEVRRTYNETDANMVAAVVVEVKTGAIRAMASMPDFDPNHYFDFKPDQHSNKVVTYAFEPASAFKIVTVAAALDQGLLRPTEVFDCEQGSVVALGMRIRDHKAFGMMNVSEILWQSSNVGSIKIALRMSDESFNRYIQAFGFGSSTGIGLPAESRGVLHPVKKWQRASRAYLSIGHELMATPLQVLMAVNVVANKGKLIKPYIAEKLIKANGTEVDLRPQDAPRQVISERTAATMIEMLRGVVTNGTAKGAQIPGVSVFGKTGTAQRLTEKGYTHNAFNASFVGFFPAENPRYGIYIAVINPKGMHKHGGEIAAPVFGRVGKMIVDYELSHEKTNKLILTDTPPDLGPEATIEVVAKKMPDFEGLGLRDLLYHCSRLGLKPEVQGEGRVVGQNPMAGDPLPDDGNCRFALARPMGPVVLATQR